MIQVIDSIMGSGKSTWMIKYINSHPEQQYLIVVPYLSEVNRYEAALENIKGFQPMNKPGGKISDFKELVASGRNICYDYYSIEDYEVLKENCELMNIDISDLIDEPEQSVQSNSKPEDFAKDDIEPGYLLQLKENKFVIAMGEKRNLFFYRFDIDKSQLNGYAFSLDDIRDDFTALGRIAIITVYGHTFSKNLGLSDRLILWERKGNDCKIYNIETSEQSIKISPNANTYLTDDIYGDIYIENLNDCDECICIKRENLPGLIFALQEIQELYEGRKE